MDEAEDEAENEHASGSLARWWAKTKEQLQNRKGFVQLVLVEIMEMIREEWEQKQKMRKASQRALEAAHVCDMPAMELEKVCEPLLANAGINYESSYVDASVEAIAAHPNLPTNIIAHLLDIYPTETFAGLARNPAFPLLPLERPDMPGLVKPYVAQEILGSGSLQVPVAEFLTLHPDPMVAWEARNTVVLAGEIKPGDDWRALLEMDVNCLCQAHLSQAKGWEPDSLRRQLSDLIHMGIISREFLPFPDPCHEEALRRRQEILAFIEKSPTLPPYSEFDYAVRRREGQRWYNRKLSGNPENEDDTSLNDDISLGEVLAVLPDTPAEVLEDLISHNPMWLRWVWNHPNANEEVRATWRAFKVAHLFILSSYSATAPLSQCLALIHLPETFDQTSTTIWDKRTHYYLPDPWGICQGEYNDLVLRCAAIPLLTDPAMNLRRWGLKRRLLKHNNRYIRAAAQERFQRVR